MPSTRPWTRSGRPPRRPRTRPRRRPTRWPRPSRRPPSARRTEALAMPVRELDVREVAEAVKTMCITANYDLPEDVHDALVKAREAEESPVGKEVLGQLVENADIAAHDRVPICQDTGFAVIFADEVHVLPHLGEDHR